MRDLAISLNLLSVLWQAVLSADWFFSLVCESIFIPEAYLNHSTNSLQPCATTDHGALLPTVHLDIFHIKTFSTDVMWVLGHNLNTLIPSRGKFKIQFFNVT